MKSGSRDCLQFGQRTVRGLSSSRFAMGSSSGYLESSLAAAACSSAIHGGTTLFMCAQAMC